MRHNKLISKFIFLFLLLFLISASSAVIAGDATSFDPTAVAVQAKGISGIPIGGVIPWPAGAVPEGFLECNGQSTSGYAELTAIVGARVPDLRGEFVRGWDHGRGVDAGRSLKSNQAAQLAAHQHQSGWGEASGASHAFAPFGCSSNRGYGGSGSSDTDNNMFYTDDARALNGGRVGSETRPRNYSMMYIIKAQ